MTDAEKQFRIIICDDDPSDANLIASEVDRIMHSASVRVCYSGDDLMTEVRDYDVVLLDIEMPETNGLTVAGKLRRRFKGVVIIFVTAIKDYVFDAFKVDAFRYLVKPIDRQELTEVLFAATERREENIRNSLPVAKSGQPIAEQGHLLVTSGGQHIAVAFSDLVYAEIFNRIVILHLVNGDSIEYYGKISDLEKLAGSDFYRCHRSYLVNLGFIKRYDSDQIILSEGIVAIAKSKYSDFVKHYMEYLKK